MTNILDLLRSGRDKLRQEHIEGEKLKLGVLRAGNTGLMTESGDVTAACARKTHLRQLGIEVDPPTDDKLIMFSLGIASEEVVSLELKKALGDGYVILRESQIPVSWKTKNGTLVTGSPDLVVCQPREVMQVDEKSGTVSKANITTPVYGLELKTVHSVWTARGLLEEPKLPNLVQAAHYMWQLKIPYYLVYKSYSALGQGMSWSPRMAAMFPKQGASGSEIMTYNERGNPKEVRQFEIAYELSITAEGWIDYRRIGNQGWMRSIARIQDIERYYEYLSEMSQTKKLPGRPHTLSVQGEELNYTDCDYCPLQPVCDSSEKLGYAKWLSAVHKHLGR